MEAIGVIRSGPRNFSGVEELYCHHPSRAVALGANPMSDLKLDSLRVQNFRTFKDLTIDRLGRVNLIVGKNNVGKTALLQALWVWIHQEFWYDIATVLEKRYPEGDEDLKREVISRRFQALSSLWYGKPHRSSISEEDISLGSPDGSRRLFTGFRDEAGSLIGNVQRPWIEIARKRDEPFEYSRVSLSEPDTSDLKQTQDIDFTGNFVSSSGIYRGDATELYDKVVRQNQKDRLVEILQIVEPEAKDVSWIEEPQLSFTLSADRLRPELLGYQGRIPVISKPDSGRSVPLEMFGEGTKRAVWLGCALVTSRGGILLIDEIENGIHYSIQPDLWQVIFETAQELDVQVFATTHSHDCVQAFQQVSGKHEEEGMLISLRRRRSDPEEIVAVPIEEEELEYAVETHTDVR